MIKLNVLGMPAYELSTLHDSWPGIIFAFEFDDPTILSQNLGTFLNKSGCNQTLYKEYFNKWKQIIWKDEDYSFDDKNLNICNQFYNDTLDEENLQALMMILKYLQRFQMLSPMTKYEKTLFLVAAQKLDMKSHAKFLKRNANYEMNWFLNDLYNKHLDFNPVLTDNGILLFQCIESI